MLVDVTLMKEHVVHVLCLYFTLHKNTSCMDIPLNTLKVLDTGCRLKWSHNMRFPSILRGTSMSKIVKIMKNRIV